MNAELKKIFQGLQLRQFAPVYLIDGEEPYYIDLITNYFEKNILTPAEQGVLSCFTNHLFLRSMY